MVSRVLSIYFKEVRGASDAMEALELFHQKKADVVISDIQMPEVDGLHLLEKIASISPNTLRIVMTAYNSPEYLNRAVESEISLYLKKPIDIDEVLFAIASNIQKCKKHKLLYFLGKGYSYNTLNKTILFNNIETQLTKKEVLLLDLLLKHKDSIVSIEQIEHNVWNEPVRADAIRMVIVGLRKKLYSRCILNVKGFGYKINLNKDFS